MASLNQNQLQAVDHKHGPLLIVAGAGTGKTTVITEKIRKLVQNGVNPQSIVALTFTQKAANEMIERLDTVMPFGYEEPWVCTFHKLCERILRREALEIGLDPSFDILTQQLQWLMVKKHLFEFDLTYYRPLGNPSKFISALLTVFSRAYDEDITANNLKLFAKSKIKISKSKEEQEESEKILEVAKAFQYYEELKIQNSALDFGDLIAQTLKLFRDRPSVLAKYKHQFEWILVDEFQDTNFAQYQLIKLLAPPHKHPQLTVVGDDSQSIYRFRGAAISNILDFMEEYPKAKQVVLTQNYRSFQPILDGAYKLIKHNDPQTLEAKLGISKNLSSIRRNKDKLKPMIVEINTGSLEVEFVVKKIYELLAKETYTYKDFAIISRSNSQLDPFVQVFKELSLPYRRIGNRGLFDLEEIRVLINFLEAVVNPLDNIALFQYLYFPGFKIPSQKILGCITQSKRKNKSLWDLLDSDDVFLPATLLIKNAQSNINLQKSSQLLYTFVQESGYLKAFVDYENLENSLKLKNVHKFFEYLRELESNNPGLTVVSLVEILTDLIKAGENPAQAEFEDIDAVTMTTVHSAKGLEFGVVFMVNLVAGRFPTYGQKEPIRLPDEILKEELPNEDNTAEERRLFYVGVTRAKDRLFLSYATKYGSTRTWKRSGFLDETGFSNTTYTSYPQLSFSDLRSDEAPLIKTSSDKFSLKFTSYSQIDTFKACPLKFKYRYVLRVPAEPHHAVSFGQSIHETLKDFHQLESIGNKPSLAELIDLYEKHFIEDGYESVQHKKERFLTGKESLTIYHQVYQQRLGTPVILEKEFRINVGGIVLKGKIDRIDKTNEGFEIVDYKTGSLGKKEEVDRDEQLTIYALAAKEALGIEVKKLSLYFIEDNQKIETTRNEKQLIKKREDLAKTIEAIKTSDFPAKPAYPFPCGFCEYNRICPMAVRK